jgi:hypothetical protein
MLIKIVKMAEYIYAQIASLHGKNLAPPGVRMPLPYAL